MATFEGNVSFVETANGFKLVADKAGKWNASNIKAGLAALLTAKVSLSPWSVWLDLGLPEVKTEDGKRPAITTAELAAFLKMADNIELVLVKRPFPQPKVKIAKGGSKGKAITNRRVI